MIPMTSAGLSKSLNQRFFLVTRAPAAPRRGERSEYGGIFDSEGGSSFQGGLQRKLVQIHTLLTGDQTVRDVFRDVLDYKLHIFRSIDWR